jgi:hypothetical protein
MLQSTATTRGVPMVVKVARSMAASTKTDLILLIPVYSTKTTCKTSTCAGTLDLEGSIHD